jgi:hypothetical protein
VALIDLINFNSNQSCQLHLFHDLLDNEPLPVWLTADVGSSHL